MSRPRRRITVEALPERLHRCPVCDIHFAPLRRSAVYCSRTCANTASAARTFAGRLADTLAEEIDHGQRDLRDLAERIGLDITVDLPARPDGSWQRWEGALTSELLDAVRARIGRG